MRPESLRSSSDHGIRGLLNPTSATVPEQVFAYHRAVRSGAMSKAAIDALRVTREDILSVARSLSPEEWAAQSDCDGWRVQDVITHMASVFATVVDPSSLPEGVPDDVEETQNVIVATRADWTPEQVLADYEDMSEKGIQSVSGFQDGPMADQMIPISNLGTHPLHLVANAFAFDAYCHLRNDILKPGGPIERDVELDDDLRLGATMEWLISGLPQMAPDALRAAVTRPIVLDVTGPGGGTWTLLPATGDDQLVEVLEGATKAGNAEAHTSSVDFVLWATHRRPWRECDITIDGDAEYAASVLDAIHVF